MAAISALKSLNDVYKAVKSVIEKDWPGNLLQLTEKFPYILMYEIKGQNAMHYAATSSASKCIQTLHRLNPNLIKKQDLEGKTPLHIAATKADMVCANILLKLGYNAYNIKDNDGKTAYDIYPELKEVICSIDPNYKQDIEKEVARRKELFEQNPLNISTHLEICPITGKNIYDLVTLKIDGIIYKYERYALLEKLLQDNIEPISGKLVSGEIISDIFNFDESKDIIEL